MIITAPYHYGVRLYIKPSYNITQPICEPVVSDITKLHNLATPTVLSEY